MSNEIKSLGAKQYFSIIILIVLLTDLAILLNIPFLRQVLGFLFLTLLSGLLIVQILKLNKIGSLEKFILSWGLSISFLMFFGLLINNLSLRLGYETPLAIIPLLISFNIAFVVLAAIGFKVTKEPFFSLPNFNLSTSEKGFLIVPIIFPALCIFGMHLMNTTDNNIILMLLLFLIPIYVALVCFFNQKFSKRLYPVVIFLISISLLLLLSLRSNHIIGVDVHSEYYCFQRIFNNLHWNILGHTSLDACLSISLLPSIYQSFLNVNGEYLYKILYSLLFSVTPLIVFMVSKKYVEDFYAFLASFFFMSQRVFLYTAYSPRTNIAILFFALGVMVLLSSRIDAVKKRILFIVFMASCIVSHYSTTYIFFFIMLFCWSSIEILAKRFTLKKSISLTMVLLFFGLIFFWYSQVTEAAFNSGVDFIERTFVNLHNLFILESRCERTQTIFGKHVLYGEDIVGNPHKIEFVLSWTTFIFIGIGVISMIKKYKEMVAIPETKVKYLKPNFLKTKFSIEYLVLTLACAGLLTIMVVLPRVSGGYDIQRLYSQMAVVLSVIFVLGGIILSKNLSFIKKALPKKKEGRKSGIWRGKENGSQVSAYLIILLILIPYFMCVTGTMYVIFDVPHEMTLSSDGHQYNSLYVHDLDSYAAKWIGRLKQNNSGIYADAYGGDKIISQGKTTSIGYRKLIGHKKFTGYVYLRYYNVVNEKLMGRSKMVYNITEYSDIFIERNRIYDNGGSEVWR